MSLLQTRMGRTAVLLGVLAGLVTWAAAQPLVDMCEGGRWTLGSVYISVSSTTMGDHSRCTCTLRGTTPNQNTATDFLFWEEGNSTKDCTTSHVTMVSWLPSPDGSGGGSQNFTCGSRATISSPTQNSDVYLTQMRSDPATIFNYCLHVQPQQASAATVAGGISGSVAFIIMVIIIIIIIIYKRRARTSKQSEEDRPGVPSASSEDVLIDNVLYESSSALADNQPLALSQPRPSNGRNVNKNGGGPSVTYCVSGNLATVSTSNASAAAAAAAAAATAARQPSSDEYAIVNKPGRQKKSSISENAAAISRSAKVVLPSGDVYTVVDKSRTPRQTPSSLPAETDHTAC